VKKLIDLSTLVLLVATVGDLSAAEIRNHYFVARRDKQAAFEVTRIYDSSASRISTTFLIADKAGPLLIATFSTDYAQHRSDTEYKLLRGKKSTASIVENLPFSGTTQAQVEREMRENAQKLQSTPVEVTITGHAKQQIHAHEADWVNAGSGQQRASARAAFGEELAAALETVAELGGLPPFADLNSSARYFLEPEKLAQRSMKLMVATTGPNCGFDAQFGHPCPSR